MEAGRMNSEVGWDVATGSGMLGDIVRGSKDACNVCESVYGRHDGKSSGS